jgi:glycosyltransferase involved in cell wall biosynthesis
MRNLVRPFETYYENHFRTKADGTTVINSFLRQQAIGLGVKPETIRLIRNGSNSSVQPVDRLVARRSLGLSETDPLIGFVGANFNRDAQFMATAFNRLLEEIPGAKLLLIGYFNRPIEKWVKNPEAVLRSGPIKSDKIYTYLSACDVCWLPFQDSGANRGRWPLKLNDYMTVARPVVATAVGDLADFIPEYGLGIVTPVDTVQFAHETRLLLQDEARAHTIGQNARKIACELFSWEKMTDELEAFYKNS